MGIYRTPCQPTATPYHLPMEAKAILKSELKRRGVSYRELAERLGDTEQNVNKKISRGGFSADWFIRCLELIGARDIRID